MTEGTGGAPAFGFGHADEHPYRRLTADWVKVPLASALLLVSAFHAGNEYAAERRIDRLFADWPERFGDVYRGLFAVGTLWGVGLVVVAALLARRWRLGLVLGLGGVAGLVRGARRRLRRRRAAAFGDAFVGVFDGTRPGSYPAVHLAVIAAVILTAEPFLTRPMRRLGQVLLAFLVIGALAVGPVGANDVFGALVHRVGRRRARCTSRSGHRRDGRRPRRCARRSRSSTSRSPTSRSRRCRSAASR